VMRVLKPTEEDGKNDSPSTTRPNGPPAVSPDGIGNKQKTTFNPTEGGKACHEKTSMGALKGAPDGLPLRLEGFCKVQT